MNELNDVANNIVTDKKDGLYYTYCTLWDNPQNEDIPFPNNRVATGKTKEESLSKFEQMEVKRKELLEKVKANIEKTTRGKI